MKLLLTTMTLAVLSAPLSAHSQTPNVHLAIRTSHTVREDGVGGHGGFCGQSWDFDYVNDVFTRPYVWRAFATFPLKEDTPFATKLRLTLADLWCDTSDATETIDIYSFDGVTLTYEDLGTGTLYASATVGKNARGNLTIDLNSAAVEHFNGLSRFSMPPAAYPGSFAIGIALRGPYRALGTPSDSEVITFSDLVTNHDAITELVVTPVPLPTRASTWGSIKALYR